jgi:uncharacterized FlaG/YvyC family protein
MTIGSPEATFLTASTLADRAGADRAGGPQTSGKPGAASRDQTPGPAAAADRAAASEHAAAVARAVQLPEFRRYELAFRRDQELDRVVVQVIDAETHTVVRSIPPEELARALRRLRPPRGVLLDQEG